MESVLALAGKKGPACYFPGEESMCCPKLPREECLSLYAKRTEDVSIKKNHDMTLFTSNECLLYLSEFFISFIHN